MTAARWLAAVAQVLLLVAAVTVLANVWGELSWVRVCLAAFCVAYAGSTAGLLIGRNDGLRGSFLLSLLGAIVFLIWTITSLAAYWLGASAYRDSPASVIVAVLVGSIGFVGFGFPAALTFFVRRRQRVITGPE